MLTARVVFTGDSITLGNGLSSPSTERYSALVDDAIPSLNSFNIAVGGATLSGDQGSDADDLFDPTKDINIVTVLFGANDMTTSGGNQTGAEFESSLEAWCGDRRAAGFTVIVVTTLAHNTDGGVEKPRRNVANALTRDDGTFWSALADIAANPLIGTDSAPDNGLYFVDGVHPTALGHSIIAPYVIDAIYQLIEPRTITAKI